MAKVSKQDVKDFGSMAEGVAKTFVLGGDKWKDSPEKRVDYGPGPEPDKKQLKPPDNYYSGYGAYAPRSPGGTKKVGKKRSKRAVRK
jgi:hypothetical protein